MAAKKKATKSIPTNSPDLSPAQNLVAQIQAFSETPNVSAVISGNAAYDPEDVISTGSIVLDYALGRGGWKKGVVVHVYGPEQSGKTTLALNSIARCQQQLPGLANAVFDVENSITGEYMENLGVDPDGVAFAWPETLEEFINSSLGLMKAVTAGQIEAIPMMVLDSVAEIQSKEVAESDMNVQDSRAPEPRVWTKGLPRLGRAAVQSGTVLLLTNQARDDMSMSYVKEVQHKGGRALKHKVGVNLLCEPASSKYMEYSEVEDGGKVKTLHAMKVRVKKNKISGIAGGSFIVRWEPGQPISEGWGFVDVLGVIDSNEERRAKRYRGNPDEYIAIHDVLPYGQFKLEADGSQASTGDYISIVFDGDGDEDEVLNAILADDPDFKPNVKGVGHRFQYKRQFAAWLDEHPTLVALMRERLLESLNLDQDENNGSGDFEYIEVDDEDVSDYPDEDDDEDGDED